MYRVACQVQTVGRRLPSVAVIADERDRTEIRGQRRKQRRQLDWQLV
jgi:hypothetical protein